MDRAQSPEGTDKGILGPYVKIGRLVGKKLHLPLVYRELHRILEGEMPAKNLYVALLEGSDRLRFPYFVDERDSEDQLATYPLVGLTAFVIERHETVWLGGEPDLLAKTGYVGERAMDWMGTPLLGREGRPIGVIAVQTYEPGQAYDAADIGLLEFAAGQLSLAIQLMLYDRDIAIARITALMDEASGLDELYEGVHEAVADLIPAARRCFIIAKIDESSERFRPVFWRDEMDDWDSLDWPIGSGFASYIYKVTQAPFIFERGRTKMPPDYVPIGTPPRYWLGVPLRNARGMIGIVIAQSYDEDDPVTREDEAMLSIVAPHIADAIGRTELYVRSRSLPPI